MNKWHDYFMNVAWETSLLSYANRLQVGSVAVRDRRIVCCGYNGTAPGRDNSCEDEDGNTKEEVLHSEQNLISFSAREGISLKDCSLYITHSPCIKCASLILAAGFKEVFYAEDYRSSEGIWYLRESGLQVTKLFKEEE